MNKLLKERSEHILTNMRKLNEERESRVNIGTNSKNHKALLQGETKSIFYLEARFFFLFLQKKILHLLNQNLDHSRAE